MTYLVWPWVPRPGESPTLTRRAWGTRKGQALKSPRPLRERPQNLRERGSALPTTNATRPKATAHRLKPVPQQSGVEPPHSKKTKVGSSSPWLVGMTMLRSREKPQNLKRRGSALPTTNATRPKATAHRLKPVPQQSGVEPHSKKGKSKSPTLTRRAWGTRKGKTLKREGECQGMNLLARGKRRPTLKAFEVIFRPGGACLRLYSLRSTRSAISRTNCAGNP